MKSLKSLLTLSLALVFSSTAFAESNSALSTIREVKETANQQISQTKQAVNSAKNTAKSTLSSDKVNELTSDVANKVEKAKSATKTTVQTIKAESATSSQTVEQSKKTVTTARETLNSAKTTTKNTVVKATEQKATKKSGKININTADVETLQALDGIGEVKAKAIVAYRQKNGEFKKVSDLTKVSGIGSSTVSKIKSSVSVK